MIAPERLADVAPLLQKADSDFYCRTIQQVERLDRFGVLAYLGSGQNLFLPLPEPRRVWQNYAMYRLQPRYVRDSILLVQFTIMPRFSLGQTVHADLHAFWFVEKSCIDGSITLLSDDDPRLDEALITEGAEASAVLTALKAS